MNFKVNDKVTVDGVGPFYIEMNIYSEYYRVNTLKNLQGYSLVVHESKMKLENKQDIQKQKETQDNVKLYSYWILIDGQIENNKTYLVMFENGSICTAARIRQKTKDINAAWVFVPSFKIMPEGINPKYYLPGFKENLTDKEFRILELENELKKLKGS